METEKRLVDANALFKAIKSDKIAWRFGVPNTLKLMFDYLRIIINEQPTVDAVEVVRCKDCIYRHTRYHCQGRRMDFFCADGERKPE